MKLLQSLTDGDQTQPFSNLAKVLLALAVCLAVGQPARAQQPPAPTLSKPAPSTPPAPPRDNASALTTRDAQSSGLLTIDEALRLSSALSSGLQQAALNEQIAAEDVRQAKSAFLPRVSAPFSYLYTSPALGLPPGSPRTPSFLANDAISEYQAYVNVTGDFDIGGRLRATLEKNRALLAAAHAGNE